MPPGRLLDPASNGRARGMTVTPSEGIPKGGSESRGTEFGLWFHCGGTLLDQAVGADHAKEQAWLGIW